MNDLNFGEVLASSWGVYKRRFWFYVGATLFTALVGFLFNLLFAVVLGAALIVSYSIKTAKANMFLRACRGENIAVVQTFSSFKDLKTVKRVFCGMGWATLWVFIWALIPLAGIVFAVIRGYEYAFVKYLVYEREDLPAVKLKEESKKMTNGYKGKMFLIDLIMFFAVVLGGVILFLLGLIPYVGYVFIALLIIYVLCALIFIPPLVNIVHAEIYLTVKGEKTFGYTDNVNEEEMDEEELLQSVLPSATQR